MRVDQARRLKDLEQENSRLKRVVADFALDNAILKEAAGETPKPVQETKDSPTGLPEAGSLGKTGLSGTWSSQSYPAAQSHPHPRMKSS